MIGTPLENKPWRWDLFKDFKPGYKWYIGFLLRFVKPVIIEDKMNKETTNYYVYKWLFGRLYVVDEYAITSFL